MNIRSLLFAVIGLSLLATACKKDDDTTTNNVGEYTKLTPGNYWIYESYLVDSLGNGTPGGLFGHAAYRDSIYVEKDTIFNAHTYHKLMKPEILGSNTYTATFLRDSLNYEVDHRGTIVLAPEDYTSIFRYSIREASPISDDSMLALTVRMADKNKSVTMPAGTFETVSMDNIWTFIPFAAQQKPVSQRRQHTRYAKGVGMISETMPFYASLPDYEERRLVRFFVK